MHLGEVRYIWHQLALQSAACGCGAGIRECKFWRAVLHEAFGGLDQVDPLAVLGLWNRLSGPRLFLGLYPDRKTKHADPLRTFLEVSEKLYAAMWRVSGEAVLIDSSKVSSYAYTLTKMKGIRLQLLHLVRDPRAVAYSWSRKKYLPDQNGYFADIRPARSSLRWIASNAAVEALKTKVDGYLRVRYEDFISDPAGQLERILGVLGKRGASIRFLSERGAFLKSQHTVSGNPSRFAVGQVALRCDDEWKGNMTTGRKRSVTALTWPLLRRYQYPFALTS